MIPAALVTLATASFAVALYASSPVAASVCLVAVTALVSCEGRR